MEKLLYALFYREDGSYKVLRSIGDSQITAVVVVAAITSSVMIGI
jgi:hypothetical protein